MRSEAPGPLGVAAFAFFGVRSRGRLMSSCSPEAYYKVFLKDGQCFSREDVRAISQALDMPSDSSMQSIGLALGIDDPTEWSSHPLIMGNETLYNMLEERLRPRMPRSWIARPTTWLNNNDIHEVLSQYSSHWKDFFFLGVHPRDFEAYYKNTGARDVRDVVKTNFDKWESEGLRRFGVVFNLDSYKQSGSH